MGKISAVVVVLLIASVSTTLGTVDDDSLKNLRRRVCRVSDRTLNELSLDYVQHCEGVQLRDEKHISTRVRRQLGGSDVACDLLFS